MRIAIVTAYYKEDQGTLMRCIESVRNQTIACDHYLVSDGFPQDWLDHVGVRHVRLGQNARDYGNTPRAIGSALAISAGYDAIAPLDADNWLDPDHVELCLNAARTQYDRMEDCDYVIAKRRFIRPDMSIMPLGDEKDHIDTSCYFYLPGSYHLLHYWGLMPQQISGIGDRVIGNTIKLQKLNAAHVAETTVNYLNLWTSSYQILGETPPPEAKPNIDVEGIKDWYLALSDRKKQIVDRQIGFKFLA